MGEPTTPATTPPRAKSATVRARSLAGIPIGKIEDHAGEKSRFRGPQQEAHHVKHGHALDEHEGHRNGPPHDHDASNPHARADTLQNQIARHFEDKVADEEQARAHAIHAAEYGRIHIENRLQLKLGKANVDAIDIGDNIAKKQQRDEPAGDLAEHSFLLGSAQDFVAR
jgi:hypothetical protein